MSLIINTTHNPTNIPLNNNINEKGILHKMMMSQLIKTTISNLKLFDLHSGTYNSFYDEYNDSMSFTYVGHDRTMKVWCDNFTRHPVSHQLVISICNIEPDIIKRRQVSYTAHYDLNLKDYTYSINNMTFADGSSLNAEEYFDWISTHHGCADPERYEDPNTWPNTLMARWKMLRS